VAGEDVEGDVSALGVNVLDLLEEGGSLLCSAVGGGEGLRVGGPRVDTALAQQVEAREGEVGERDAGAHRLLPRRHRRVAGETGDELEDVRVRARWHIDR